MHGIPYPYEYFRIPNDETWYPVIRKTFATSTAFLRKYNFSTFETLTKLLVVGEFAAREINS